MTTTTPPIPVPLLISKEDRHFLNTLENILGDPEYTQAADRIRSGVWQVRYQRGGGVAVFAVQIPNGAVSTTPK